MDGAAPITLANDDAGQAAEYSLNPGKARAYITQLFRHVGHAPLLRAARRWGRVMRSPRRTIPQDRAALIRPLPYRHHFPASKRSIGLRLAGYPDWMIDACLTWTREREARGHQFTDGTAAAQHWLDHIRSRPRAARDLV